MRSVESCIGRAWKLNSEVSLLLAEDADAESSSTLADLVPNPLLSIAPLPVELASSSSSSPSSSRKSSSSNLGVRMRGSFVMVGLSRTAGRGDDAKLVLFFDPRTLLLPPSARSHFAARDWALGSPFGAKIGSGMPMPRILSAFAVVEASTPRSDGVCLIVLMNEAGLLRDFCKLLAMASSSVSSALGSSASEAVSAMAGGESSSWRRRTSSRRWLNNRAMLTAALPWGSSLGCAKSLTRAKRTETPDAGSEPCAL